MRIGLVGYGFGGRYFHAPLLASADECDFVGVVTTSPERRALVATEWPGVAIFESLAALVASGAEAVAISTPADTHSALTDEAIGLGLHVVCDKPFAMDAASAARSVALAAERGRVLSPYQNRRWDSDFLTARRLVDSGQLGAVFRFESRFERFKPQPGPGAAGGGTMLDFGSHLADQALVLLGPVASVYAEWVIADNGLDDDVFVALTHASGARSHLWGSSRQAAPGPRFRVSGSAAAYVLDAPMDCQEHLLLAGHTPRSLGEQWGVEAPERWGRVVRGADADAEVVASSPGAWQTFYPSFAAAVRGDGPPPVAPEDAVETAKLLDAARESASTGRTIQLR